MKTLATLNDALFFQLQGLYDADQKIQNAIPDFIESASSPELKALLTKYQQHAGYAQNKLTWVYEYLDRRLKSRTNKVIGDLIEEALSMTSHASTEEVLDATLIGYVHIISHYKIAAYGTCRAFAYELRLHNIYDIFNDLLVSERNLDEEFTQLANEQLNEKAFEVSYLRRN